MFIFRLRTLGIFYRELETMLNSGMDIIGIMDVLSSHFGDRKLKAVIIRLKQYLLSGDTLSNALSKFPQLFPEWQINIVKYSEAAGRLNEGLMRIADYLEKDYDIQKNLIVGLAYPFVLLHVAIFLFPLAKLITGNPIAYFFEVLKVLFPLYLFFFGIYAFKGLLRLAWLKKGYDGLILNIPILGGLFKRLTLARFIRSLRCLCDSGVNIVQSWRIAVSLCGNSIIRNSLLKALAVIERGEQISHAFSQAQVFPPRVIGMVVAAERSGSINAILEKIAVYYEKENELLIGVLVRTIPLFIYVIVGCYIMYRIISFYMGYFSRLPIF